MSGGRLPARALVMLMLVGGGFAAASAAQSATDGESVGSQQTGSIAAARQAEHERIRHAREAVNARRQRDEAVCYQRFMVEDCLRGVRAQARDDEARLRVREIELNDAERKEKAAARLKTMEERQRAVPHTEGAPGRVLRAAPPDPAKEKGLRDAQAAQRAEQQRSRLQQRSEEQVAREKSDSERAARARLRHAQRLEAAQQRRDRVTQTEQEAASQGRKRPAPLPTEAADRP